MTDTVVVKVGGSVLGPGGALARTLDSLAEEIGALDRGGTRVVVVHGAGPVITEMLGRLGLSTSFVAGLRVTDEATMDVVAMSLALVNLKIVAGLGVRGVNARGVAGPDGGLLTATAAGAAWGKVGVAVRVDGRVLAVETGSVVVNPVALDETGDLVNCNGDEVAGAIAGSVRARALVLLSDVEQVRRTRGDATSGVSRLSVSDAEALVHSGAVDGGMIPKVRAACAAVRAGAGRVVIAHGHQPGAVRAALAGLGPCTEVVP